MALIKDKAQRDCDRASGLIMGYMDGALSEEGSAWLKSHIDSCEKCRSDFAVYNTILNEFSEAEVILCAPEGFDEAVAVKLETAVDPVSKRRRDNIACAVWGILSVVLGLAALIVINRERVLALLEDSGIYAGLSAVLSAVAEFAAFAGRMLTDGAVYVGGLLADYRYFILAALAVAALAQYLIYMRKSGARLKEAYADKGQDKR